ncbi:MAG: molecular chaperone DnaJ [archaeon]
MAEKDYYKILGVEKNASQEDIKKAYKTLAKKHHPDLNKEPGASDKFKELNEAASVLGDEEKRKQYDQFGTDAFKYAGGRGAGYSQDFSGFDFSDFGSDRFDFDSIFDSFFAGGGRSRGRRSNKGRDLGYELKITLEEAANGVKRQIKVTKNDVCESCGGKGGRESTTCPHCRGSGAYRETRRTPFGLIQTTATCRNCNGSGEIFKEVCKSCEGTGRLKDTKTIEVSIPAGIMDEARLRVSGEGEAGYRGGQPGDLYLVINVEPHDTFTREDDDIVLELEISFTQAALGDKIKVPTINGEASLKISEGTQPGTVLRMKGEGIKHMHGFGRGDQLVKINIKVPHGLNKKQAKLLNEFDESL